MVQGRGLALPHIEARAGQMPRGDGLCQRLLVVDAAARGADEDRARFHEGERRRVDQLQGTGLARTVQRHHIGLRQQLRQRDRLRPAPYDFIVTQQRVGGQHPHAEGRAQGGDPGADVAQADQPQRLAGDLAPGQVLAREAALLAQPAVALGDAARHREDQAQRVLGHRDRVATGLVDHRDAGLRAGGHIDRVVARAIRGHAQQRRAMREQVGADQAVTRQFVLGSRHMEHMGVAQRRVRGRRAVGHGEHPRVDAGLAGQALIEHRIDPGIEADHLLSGRAHRGRIPRARSASSIQRSS